LGEYNHAGVAYALSLALAAGNWVAVWRGRRKLQWVLKPAAQACVLVAAILLTRGPHDEWLARFLVPSLALGLLGDILLLLPGPGFLAGLVAFLLGHVCTIAGLTPSLPPATALAFVGAALALGVTLYRPISRGLRIRDQRHLLGPVGAYTAVIGLMFAAAWATLLRPDWSPVRRLLAIGGASLFAASDAMLAWERFVSSSRSGPLRVMVTYHLAQMALAASLALL